MVIVKRLYTFVLQRFMPVFAMTFFITLFIVMMQFLWRYIDDLVGKGLSMDIIGELFFYASLTMVPTALPLAVLLASLMTFGNLGEKFELTAMKAAGISLFQIMRPLIIFIVLVATGAFFFQNDILPVAQTKMWTLMFSIRQKTPEVEIPEKTFYGDLPGMNLFVTHKDRQSGRLDDLIIYDTSRGMDKVRIILADSGRIAFTEDKSKLCIDLFQGELYEDFKDNVGGRMASGYLPFRRETFTRKTAYLEFDANFNRMDDSTMRAQYIGKNIAELRVAIDSIQTNLDHVSDSLGQELKTYAYFGMPYYETRYVNHEPVKVARQPVKARLLDIDSIFNAPNPDSYRTYARMALTKAQRHINEYQFRALTFEEQQKSLRRHQIEMHKKFTLSIACIIFFFIGAPLGAIIKKGGLGMPLVVSVFLFVVYFIFDNMGYKMARDGKSDVITGIWLSTMVMFPLGVFFTWKAVGDTTMFDFDYYIRLWRNLKYRLGMKVNDVRFAMKDFVINEVDHAKALELIGATRRAADKFVAKRGRRLSPGLFTSRRELKELRRAEYEMSDYLSDTRRHEVIAALNLIPEYLNRASMPALRKALDKLDNLYSDAIPIAEITLDETEPSLPSEQSTEYKEHTENNDGDQQSDKDNKTRLD